MDTCVQGLRVSLKVGMEIGWAKGLDVIGDLNRRLVGVGSTGWIEPRLLAKGRVCGAGYLVLLAVQEAGLNDGNVGEVSRDNLAFVVGRDKVAL